MQHLLRLFFGSGADGDRPVLITVLFWGGVIPTLVVRTFVTAPELLVPTWVVYVLIATLVALWPLLRWRAGGRPIATAAFALTVLLVLFADGTGAAQLLLPLTIAQVIIVTGWTGTLLTIAAYALAQILGMRLVYDRPWRDVALQTLSVVLLMTMIASGFCWWTIRRWYAAVCASCSPSRTAWRSSGRPLMAGRLWS